MISTLDPTRSADTLQCQDAQGECCEVWNDVVGYKGLYRVSNFGRVRSLKFGNSKILKPILNARGYFQVTLCKDGIPKNINIHKLVQFAFFLGEEYIDHINRDKTDNRLINLRVCTHAQNLANQKSQGGTSKFKGVCWCEPRKKWRAYVNKNKKQYFLGYFVDEKSAAQAHDKKAKELHGEFACLNSKENI